MRSSAFASLGLGWFSDVALLDGGGWLIGGFETPAIVVRVETWTGRDVSPPGDASGSLLLPVFSSPLLAGTGYSRIYAYAGEVWAAYHDGVRGHLWNFMRHGGDGGYWHRVLEPCENNSPICFGSGYVAWQGAAAQSWPVSRMSLSTFAITPNVRQGVGTGLSRVLGDGTVVTIDEDRFTLPGATQPCYAGDLAVGEADPDGALWTLDAQTGVAWPGQECFTPRCALDGDTVAITPCGGKHGIRLFCGSRAELAELQREQGPPIPPDPPPTVVLPPKFTIAVPSFPVSGVAPFALVCIYALEPGSGPVDWIEWLQGPSASGPWTVSAHNPGSDPDHTYRFPAAGVWYIKARAGNAAGIHETGAERKVTVTAAEPIPPIPPEPPIEPTDQLWLKTVHGGYLTVGADKFLQETPHGDVFELVASDTPGFVGLKVNGAYVAAEPDNRLKADRGAIAAWEYFRAREVEGGLTLLSRANGRYMSAHGDGIVRTDQPIASSWETFTWEPAPANGGGGGGGGPLSPLHVDQWQFRDATGAAVRIKGFSGFPLLTMIANGSVDVVDPILKFFTGHAANTVRVWPYVTWPGTGWESPTNDQILAGIQYLESHGLRSYLTLFTDSQPPTDSSQQNRIQWAKDLIHFLQGKTTALLVEIGNEPQINKTIDTHALKSTLDASGFLYTSGEYDDSAHWFGHFGDAHTPRDIQWCRKAHDLHEYYVGGGPSYPAEPATKTVWIAGEPMKPTEEPNAPQTDPDTGVVISKVEDNLAYAAACSLMGGGAIFHYEGGKFGRMPVGEEIDCAAAFFQGLSCFPDDMLSPSAYVRTDEHGETLRTYSKGPYTVRIRPKSGPIIISG